MQFEIPLAEQRVKPHQVTALHLLAAFALLAATAIALLINNNMVVLTEKALGNTQANTFDSIDLASSVLMSFSLIVIIAGLFRNRWLRSDKVNRFFRIIELLSCVLVAVYLLTIGFNILAALFGILAATVAFSIIWESEKKGKSLIVTVEDNNIKLPITTRRRIINWAETEKVLLRHGTLTISCTNNRLYQWMTGVNDIDSETFEAYCDAQIEAAKKNRKKHDW